MYRVYSTAEDQQIDLKASQTLSAICVKEEIYWFHFEEPTEEDYELLKELFNFEKSTIEECKNSEHYPKIEDYEDYLFLVTFFVKHLPGSLETYNTEELNIFLGSNYLVTIQKKASLNSSLKIIEDRAKRSHKLLKRGPDFLLSEVLDSLAESYIPVIEEFDDQIDYLEALIFKTTHPKTLKKIFELKKQVMSLKRLLIPQQEMLFRISLQEHDLIDERNRLLLRNVFDHFSRLTMTIDSYRDSVASLFDAYRSQASNSMNEIMKVLTIFSTIILPLTLVVGYYGMNFDYFPELHWKSGLKFVWGIMLGVIAGMLIFFKLRRWL